ncbi:hypothetical protein A2U01_0065648, partial [Trifolium medium]|nr:hypothetical protein [Trifolium medium]
YFNGGNANLFRIHVDVTLPDLKNPAEQDQQPYQLWGSKKGD